MRSDYKDNKLVPPVNSVQNNWYDIGGKKFLFNQTYVMGILNVTPDSFSDGGMFFNREDAVNHGLEMLNTGADIIDIGGESTRPGSESVSAFEEINRVIPVLEEILSKKPDAVISIDTTKSKVAAEALKRGASIINDISGGTFDAELINTVKNYDAALIIMHIKGTPKNMQLNPVYENLIEDVLGFLNLQALSARRQGIDKIIIDPGIGFGKTFEHNLTIIKELHRFTETGYPVMIGVSRKSFINKIIGDLSEDRDVATAVINALAVKNGATFLRTHNVLYGLQVSRILQNL
ncbi:MAG TPA: dihydropteroate synthase [Ignavibacteriaceae bacterium]